MNDNTSVIGACFRLIVHSQPILNSTDFAPSFFLDRPVGVFYV